MRSMCHVLLLGAAAAALLLPASAEVFGRCQLVAALKDKSVQDRDVATWVCIAERLSGIDTDTITDPSEDPDGTSYHGIFLVSDKWWCDRGKQGCGMTCSDMRRTLASNIDCAMKVFAETRRLKKDGFRAWGAYADCQDPASYVSGCQGGRESDLTDLLRSGAART